MAITAIKWSINTNQNDQECSASLPPQHIPFNTQFPISKFPIPPARNHSQELKNTKTIIKIESWHMGSPQNPLFYFFKRPFLIATPFHFLGHSLKFLVSLSFLNSISMEGGSENQQEKYVYSVWGLPQEDLRPRLKKLMDGLGAEFNGPEFEPHVTVVGAVSLTESEARHKFNKACEGLKAYNAKVEKVATGTFFYQCVFLLLQPTPEVVETSDHCCGHFGYLRSSPYMPHLSLLYADLSEEEKKAAEEKAYALDETIGNLNFEISRLALCKTDTEDKSLKSWEKVAEYPLNSN